MKTVLDMTWISKYDYAFLRIEADHLYRNVRASFYGCPKMDFVYSVFRWDTKAATDIQLV
jgi:hypothetical protein